MERDVERRRSGHGAVEIHGERRGARAPGRPLAVHRRQRPKEDAGGRSGESLDGKAWMIHGGNAAAAHRTSTRDQSRRRRRTTRASSRRSRGRTWIPAGPAAGSGAVARFERKRSTSARDLRGIPPLVLGYPENSSKLSFRRQIELVSHDSWTVRIRSPSSRRLAREPPKIRSGTLKLKVS